MRLSKDAPTLRSTTTSAPPGALVASREPAREEGVDARVDRFDRALGAARVDEGFAALDAAHPLWRAVLAAATNPGRAGIALDLLRARGVVEAGNARDAAVLVWAAGTTRDAAETEGLVTPVQGLRALEKLRATAPATRAAVVALLDAAGSTAERAVLLKGLAARTTREDGALLSELTELAARVRGRPLDALARDTTGYGLAATIEAARSRGAADGQGVTQAFRQACGPSIRVLAEAEIDPLLALRLSDDLRAPDDPRSVSGTLQRRVLDEQGAPAHRRDVLGKLRALLAGEHGTNLGSYLQAAFEGLGVSFVEVPWDNLDDARKTASLDELERRLHLGLDVPLHVVDARGGAGHYVCLVDAATLSGKRAWRVHDPDTGRTRWIDDQALARGAVTADGRRLSRLYVPNA